jgi:hypothetical protein
MKLYINDKKEIVNLFWESDDKNAVDVDVSSIQDLKKEHEANIRFNLEYGISKYYLDDNNVLQVRTEESLEIIEAKNNKIIEQRRIRYEKEVDPLVLEAVRTDNIDLLEQANIIVDRIKQELPKKVK